MISKKNRKEMEDKIYTFFNLMDPTGDNTKKYKELIGNLNDAEFNKFFKEFFKNPNNFLTLDIITYEREITMEDIEKTAKFMKVPLYEHVVLPHVSTDPSKPVVTPYPVPVGRIHVKRLQQMARKKNSTSTEIGTRDSKTGQVVGGDKNSRLKWAS